MQNYKIIVKYDGSRYQGWQRQVTTDLTIQGKIEAVLSKMVGEKVEIDGAGRTDANVHAYAQVASFKLEKEMVAFEVLKYLNEYLPEDISVVSCKKVPPRFHARLNAKSKVYEYRIFNHVEKPVFDRKYVYQIEEKLNTDILQKAANEMIGNHDFQSFTSAKKGKKSTVRNVHSIEVIEEGKEIKVRFSGDGFLYHMIRIMMGTMIEVAQGQKRIEDIKSIIEAKDRSAAGYLVPGKGLALVEVSYE